MGAMTGVIIRIVVIIDEIIPAYDPGGQIRVLHINATIKYGNRHIVAAGDGPGR